MQLRPTLVKSPGICPNVQLIGMHHNFITKVCKQVSDLGWIVLHMGRYRHGVRFSHVRAIRVERTELGLFQALAIVVIMMCA